MVEAENEKSDLFTEEVKVVVNDEDDDESMPDREDLNKDARDKPWKGATSRIQSSKAENGASTESDCKGKDEKKVLTTIVARNLAPKMSCAALPRW